LKLCVPAALVSSTRVVISSPSVLNICNLTLLSVGSAKLITVLGLNGFG